MSKTAFVDFRAIKARAGIRQILERYGLAGSLAETGEKMEGPCPLCEGESDSFKVSQEKNCFHCFRCGAGGNVLDLVSRMEPCTIREAGIRISEWFGIEAGRRAGPASPAKPRPAPGKPDSGPGQAGNPAGDSPNPQAPNGREATAAPLTFELRLDRGHPWLAEAGILPETAEEFGLGFCSKGMMAGRIAFPLRDRDGGLLGYAGRWPGPEAPEGQPLWKYPPGLDLRAVVFPMHKLAGSRPPAIRWADDPLEVVLGWQRGERNLAATPTREVSLYALRVLAQKSG